MRRDEVIDRLRRAEAAFGNVGVHHLCLFGSTARDEARPDSDVDLFFGHERGKIGLYGLMDVMDLAASALGRPADVMTRASLHPALRADIEATALRVF